MDTAVLQGEKLARETRVLPLAPAPAPPSDQVYTWGNAEWGALGSPNLLEPERKGLRPKAFMWRSSACFVSYSCTSGAGPC